MRKLIKKQDVNGHCEGRNGCETQPKQTRRFLALLGTSSAISRSWDCFAIARSDIRINASVLITTLLILLFLTPYSHVAFATIPENENSESPVQTDRVSIEETWGINILSIRQSANGYILDFRYRVIDPDKASLLLNRKIKPYLIDQVSGARFMVPSSPKIGPLRQSAIKPLANRNYFILFANPGKYVKPGNKVTVVIGEFRAEDLVVE